MSLDGTLNSTLLDGTLTFQTLTPFTGVDVDLNEPDAGQLKIIGANNSNVKLSAIGGGQLTLEVDTNGDGVVDTNGTSTTTWTALDAAL